MTKRAQSLAMFPRIVLRAVKKSIPDAKCQRCSEGFSAGDVYIRHSTDGTIHARCLRIGKAREFKGRALCQ